MFRLFLGLATTIGSVAGYRWHKSRSDMLLHPEYLLVAECAAIPRSELIAVKCASIYHSADIIDFWKCVNFMKQNPYSCNFAEHREYLKRGGRLPSYEYWHLRDKWHKHGGPGIPND